MHIKDSYVSRGKPSFSGSGSYGKLLKECREEAVGQVDQAEVERFLTDSRQYGDWMAEGHKNMTYTGASDTAITNERKRRSDEMAIRANRVRAWLQSDQNSLTPESSRTVSSYLDDFRKFQEDSQNSYSHKQKTVQRYGSEEAWGKALRQSGYQEKYGQMSKQDLNAAAAALPDGEEKQWLNDYYGEALRSEADYDHEIAMINWQLGRLGKVYDDFSNTTRWVQDEADEQLNQKIDRYRENYESPQAVKKQMEQLQTRRYHLEQGKKYNLIPQNEDFTEKAKYSGDGSYLQNMVNNPKTADREDTAKHIFTAADPVVIGGIIDAVSYENVHLMTAEERMIFNYLHNTQGEDAAKEYMDWLQYTLNQRSAMKLNNWVADRTQDIPVLSQAWTSLASVPLRFMGGSGILDAAGQKVVNAITGDDKPVDYNRDAMMISQASSTVRSSVARQLNDVASIQLDEEKHPILASWFNGVGIGDLYSAGMSMVDSSVVAAATAINPIAGQVASALLSASSATDTMLQSAANGATDGQAITAGLAAGFFEWFFEKYEIESLMKQGKSVRTAMLKQGFIEAVGEGATELCNIVTNTWLMAENSDWKQKAEEYLKQNPELDRSQAENLAMMDMVMQVLKASAAGFLTGAAMGGAAGAVNTVRFNADLQKLYSGAAPQMVSNLLAADPENALGLKLEKKLSDGKELSGAELQKLLTALETQEAAGQTDSTVAQLMEGIEPVNKGTTPRQPGSEAISDLVDESVAQLTGAPTNPVGAALEGFRSTGAVTNKQATDILNNAAAVQQLVREAGLKLPETASGKRAAVKEAVSRLAQSESIAAETVRDEEAPTETNTQTDISAAKSTEGIRTQIRARQEDLNAMEPVAQIQTPKDFSAMDAAVNKDAVGAAPEGFDTYSHLQFEYGNKPDRTGTVRDINVPKMDASGQRVSDFAANLYGNAITSDTMVQTMETLIAQGAFGAQTMKLDDVLNNSADRVAKGYINKDGSASLTSFTNYLSASIAEGRYSPELLADALVMMTKAESEGRFEDAGVIAFLASDITRAGGRILNVAKLTQRLTPEGQFAARKRAAEKVSEEVNARRKNGKREDIAISEATEQEFLNVATAGEAVVTDATNAINQGLPFDAEAAADAAIVNTVNTMAQETSQTGTEDTNTAETESASEDAQSAEKSTSTSESSQASPDPTAETAGAENSSAAHTDGETAPSQENRIYHAIREFVKSKTKKAPGSRKKATKALDALKEFYANRADFEEAWNAARRRAEMDLADDPVAYDAFRQFLDTGGNAQDIMDTYDSGSVTRKALREAAKGADVELSRLVSSSLKDKAAALQSIQDYVAQKYELDGSAASQMAHQLQEAFYRELQQRQLKRLRSLFGEKNVKESDTAKDLFAELYNTGAFENGALISREALKKIFGHDGLSLSQELLAEYGQVSDARKAAVDRKIIHEIAEQLPTDLRHILGKWRYTAMLANPSTHLKNIIGNTGQFVIQYGLKDNLSALIEAGVSKVSGGKIKRTKAILNPASAADRALINDALNDYGTVMRNNGEIAKRIKNGGKYDSVRSEVEEVRRSWKINHPSNAVTKGIDKGLSGLEYVADFNTKALDAEDAFFGRNAYALSLAAYMKANGLTEITEEARTYAVAQAQECTFHDDSLIYKAVSGRVGKVAKLVVPFVKTPANVTSRAVEYSPGMILKFGYDLIKLGCQSGKTDVELNGKRMTAAQAIDDLSKGLVGSSMWAVGIWMAAEGLIRVVGTGSEEEREYQRLMGYKDYSLCIGDTCIDISCLSPAILPVFTGAAIYESLNNFSEDEVSLQTVLDSVYSFTDPILSSSMLSGLDSFMYAIRSMGDSGTTGELAGTVGREIVETYVSQFFPSLLRRIAAGSDNTVRQTYADPKNPFSAFTQNIQSGTPGARENLKAKYDVWGQEIKQDASGGGDGFWGGAWRTINPARVADTHSTDIDDEILRLSSAGLDAIPGSNAKTITVDGEKYRLSAEEYGTYEQAEGQLSFSIAQEMIHSDAYKALPDELKAKALNNAYSYAAEYCKSDAVAGYTPKVDQYLSGMGKDAVKLASAILIHAASGSVTDALTGLATACKGGDSTAPAVSEMETAYATYNRLPEAVRSAVDEELSGRSEAFIAAREAGISSDTFAALYGQYYRISNDSTLGVGAKAQQWSYALDQAANITAAQKRVLKEKLTFNASSQVTAGDYDKMTAAGISTKTADYVADLMRDIQPEPGRSSVRTVQKLEAITEDTDLSDQDLEAIIPLYLSEGQQERFGTAMDRGYSPEEFVEAYRVVLDKEKGQKKPSVIREIAAEAGLSYGAAKRLYEIMTEKTA